MRRTSSNPNCPMTQHQTETFVPLTAAPASSARREFNVSVIRADAPPKDFASLESARPVGPAPSAPHNDKKSCEPKVTVQRDNGRVTSLRIQCTCGQTIELACSYDNAPAK